MIGLIQRVSSAEVEIAGACVGRIGRGVLALVAVQPGDSEAKARRLAERILTYRIFSDADGRMNESLRDQGLGVLAVPQFTLAANTKKGTRPSFASAAPPQLGTALFDVFVAALADQATLVAQGQFGADMQVSLTNDGPVTFWLEV